MGRRHSCNRCACARSFRHQCLGGALSERKIRRKFHDSQVVYIPLVVSQVLIYAVTAIAKSRLGRIYVGRYLSGEPIVSKGDSNPTTIHML